jgi:hypothetical protein
MICLLAIIFLTSTSFASDFWSVLVIDSTFQTIERGTLSEFSTAPIDSSMIAAIENNDRYYSWKTSLDSILDIGVVSIYQEPLEPGRLDFWTQSNPPQPLLQITTGSMPPGGMALAYSPTGNLNAIGTINNLDIVLIDSLFAFPTRPSSAEIAEITSVLNEYNVFGKSLIIKLPPIGSTDNPSSQESVYYYNFENGMQYVVIVYNQLVNNSNVRYNVTKSAMSMEFTISRFNLSGRALPALYQNTLNVAEASKGMVQFKNGTFKYVIQSVE